MSYILFKAKRINSEEYDGTWIEGIPIKNHIGLFMCFDENPHYCSQYGYMEIENVAMVDESTLCRYTGLTDENNRKVFENDIVEFRHGGEFSEKGIWHRNYVIEYVNTFCTYGLRFRNKSIHFPCKQSTILMHDVRVIGNIFDNPELLKAGQQSNADVLLPAT